MLSETVLAELHFGLFPALQIIFQMSSLCFPQTLHMSSKFFHWNMKYYMLA